MCSHTSSLSGGSGGGYGGGGHGGGVDGIYSKKTKRQRTPKRGPGVAELEKILREQEKNNYLEKAKNIQGFSFFQPQQSPIFPRSSSFSTKTGIPFVPDHNPTSPTKTRAFYVGDISTSLGVNGNCGKDGTHVHFGGSGIAALPKHALLSTMWNNNNNSFEPRLVSGFPVSNRSGSNSNSLFPSTTLMQRSQFSPSSMVNRFQHPAVSSSFASSSSHGVVMCHGIEPPSNQTTSYHHHCTLAWPEEDKLVTGTKRPHHFAMEIPLLPTFRYQVPEFAPQMNRTDSSFPFSSGSPINVETTKAISRDMKPEDSMEPNLKRAKTDSGVANGNFMLFGALANPHQEQSKSSPLHFHKESAEESQQMQGQGGTVEKKPFYSFLQPPKKAESSCERFEAKGDGIDLNLHL